METENTGASPLGLDGLKMLFFHPRRFYRDGFAIEDPRYFVFVTWALGISSALNEVDEQLMRAELGSPRPGWESLRPLLTESWLGFWGYALMVGAVSGGLYWLIGGWWYRKRLTFSGVSDPDPRLARLLYVYASFVYAGPIIALTAWATVSYPNYLAAYQAEDVIWLAVLIFPFWSIRTSYTGIRARFEVVRSKALVWFVVLPTLVYLLAYGVLATLYAVLAPVS